MKAKINNVLGGGLATTFWLLALLCFVVGFTLFHFELYRWLLPLVASGIFLTLAAALLRDFRGR